MENDETMAPEDEQDIDSSIDETNKSGNAEEKAIPYHRFKEVNDSYKATKAEIEALKEQIANLKPTTEEEKEPETWKEVEERAAKRAIAEFKKERQIESQKEAEMEEVIDKGFEQLERLGQKITPEIKKAVLTEIVKTGDSVHDAYISIQSQLKKKDTSDQIKVEGALPNSKGIEAKGIAIPYKDLHNLSMEQLIARAQNHKK